MTRQAFMARLREGLRGLPPQAQADILADYETHFADGHAAGRSEADVAQALGDPGRLARELRAEAGLRRWEEDRNPSGAAAAVFALLGLGALDVLVMLPVIMAVGGTIFGFAVAALAIFAVGGAIFAAGPFTGMPGGPAAAILAGIGLMTGGIAFGAVVGITGVGFVNAVVWYARLHFRLLKPSLDPQDMGAMA
jgi:uncharacterized membrane protein